MSSATEEDALEALRAHNLKLLKTGKHSDFTIVCGDRTWNVHKLILCRVEYFNKVILLKGSGESQLNIPNFQPFEIDLLLRYIYYPRVDAEVARFQEPTQTFLELCVRLWQLGDRYGIKTLAMTAEEQMWVRIRRYIAEAGHVADMQNGVPFVSELESAIRAAWDPKKVPGPHRDLLLSLCQALAPYLREYPEILKLFDKIPQFASDFSKAVLGCDVAFPRRSESCATCGWIFSTENAYLRQIGAVYHPTAGFLSNLNGGSEKWYCTAKCFEEGTHARVNHDHCEICERDKRESEYGKDGEELME